MKQLMSNEWIDVKWMNKCQINELMSNEWFNGIWMN